MTAYPGASCVMCGTEFPGVGAFCSDRCRGESVLRHEERMLAYYRQRGSIWPGDTVRRKTPVEKALEELRAWSHGFH